MAVALLAAPPPPPTPFSLLVTAAAAAAKVAAIVTVPVPSPPVPTARPSPPLHINQPLIFILLIHYHLLPMVLFPFVLLLLSGRDGQYNSKMSS